MGRRKAFDDEAVIRAARAVLHYALGGMAEAVTDQDGKADVLTATPMGVMPTSGAGEA